MAQQDKTAAETQRKENEAFVRKEREIDALGGVRELPEPKHGNPTELAPPGIGGSVVGVRVGSEAAVESGTGPVLPPPNAAGGEFTRVRNRDLQERDRKEWKKRGMREDGTPAPGRTVSVSFEGVMVVETEQGEKGTLHSGGYTGQVPDSGLFIRPLSDKEEQEYFGSPQAHSQRSNDLVAGGGQGGGGNPMHAGDVRGVSSNTARRVGEGGVTSASGPAPAPRPGGAGAPTTDKK